MSFASLSIKDLGASYGTQRILKNLSLTLENDPALVITGPSGCGKSTLLKICAGILPCTEGNVTLSMPDGKRPHAAMVPQGGVLMPWKNVYDNLALPLKIQKSDHREDKIVRMLAELELTGLEKRFPHELSGGQRQRLCLGQALIGDPEILFLDEPFSACDTMLKEKLQLFLKKLLKKRSCLLLVVTHDLNEAIFLAPKILILGSAGSGKYLLHRNHAFTDDLTRHIREEALFALEAGTLHRLLRQMRPTEEADAL